MNSKTSTRYLSFADQWAMTLKGTILSEIHTAISPLVLGTPNECSLASQTPGAEAVLAGSQPQNGVINWPPKMRHGKPATIYTCDTAISGEFWHPNTLREHNQTNSSKEKDRNPRESLPLWDMLFSPFLPTASIPLPAFSHPKKFYRY